MVTTMMMQQHQQSNILPTNTLDEVLPQGQNYVIFLEVIQRRSYGQKSRPKNVHDLPIRNVLQYCDG